MTGRLVGRVALITGAARGQGRSHAVRLAEEGADIVAVDRCAPIDTADYPMGTEADLEETAGLVEACGRRVVTGRADVRDFDAVKAVADEGVERFGHLDIVCANAGIFAAGTPLHLTPAEQWDDVIGTNLTGVWNTCKAAVPHLITRGRGGSIVITGSTASQKAPTNAGVYAASKHGVVGLMRAFAVELAPMSIRVNIVHPTSVATEMIHNESVFRLFRPDLEQPTEDDAREPFQRINLLPIPWVEPADVSAAVAFLASDDARFITGAELLIDAGNLLK